MRSIRYVIIEGSDPRNGSYGCAGASTRSRHRALQWSTRTAGRSFSNTCGIGNLEKNALKPARFAFFSSFVFDLHAIEERQKSS